jgi:hypothetical protein
MAKIDYFVDELLLQCAFAIGRGAQMPIERKAIAGLAGVVRGGFVTALKTGVKDPEDETQLNDQWKTSSEFIISCCIRIGHVAATNADLAKPSAHFAITEADLKAAYKSVRAAFAAGLPGEYCPDW